MSLKTQIPRILGALVACGIILIWTHFGGTNQTCYSAMVGIIAGTTWAIIVDLWKNRK